MNDKCAHEPIKAPWAPAVVLLLVVLALWALWAMWGVQMLHMHLSSAPDGSASLAGLGQVGDLFGGINAVFAASALVGVFWAGMLQRATLLETKRALQAEQRELREERQFRTRQQWEATFFQLLTLVRDVAAGVTTKVGADERVGFRALNSMAHTLMDRALVKKDPTPEEALEMGLSWYVKQTYRNHPSALGVYFRTLYHLFKQIEAAPDEVLPEVEKVRFATIARAQISDGAVLLLAFGGLTKSGAGFQALIEKYGLLEHMLDRYQAAWKEGLLLVYQPHAFLGSSERARTAKVVHAHPLANYISASDLDQVVATGQDF
ncbi:putative phage abortive infection protein [Caldimonas sp. KR1-144]|uniref:putative phage abortive infection protein n=1 Tax=Caldimonas sp. KR1-144 TaxID=3400911 RepID=UPI003C11A1E3